MKYLNLKHSRLVFGESSAIVACDQAESWAEAGRALQEEVEIFQRDFGSCSHDASGRIRASDLRRLKFRRDPYSLSLVFDCHP